MIVSEEDDNSAHDDDDALSIQCYDNEIDGLLDQETKDENSVSFLTEISASLFHSNDHGWPIKNELARLVDNKFATELVIENRKEISQGPPKVWGTIRTSDKPRDLGKAQTLSKTNWFKLSTLQNLLIPASSV